MPSDSAIAAAAGVPVTVDRGSSGVQKAGERGAPQVGPPGGSWGLSTSTEGMLSALLLLVSPLQ